MALPALSRLHGIAEALFQSLFKEFGGGCLDAGAGARIDNKGQQAGGREVTKAVAGGEKPQEFKELRIGRCFTFTPQTYNNLLNTLNKTSPKEKNWQHVDNYMQSRENYGTSI